jgi:hypothetical protein
MATDLIDQLIYQALQDEVKGTEPSPQVWDNICERIACTDVTCQGGDVRAWVPLLRIGAQVMLDVLSGDDDWEARLAKHRVPVSWLLPFAGALVWAV